MTEHNKQLSILCKKIEDDDEKYCSFLQRQYELYRDLSDKPPEMVKDQRKDDQMTQSTNKEKSCSHDDLNEEQFLYETLVLVDETIASIIEHFSDRRVERACIEIGLLKAVVVDAIDFFECNKIEKNKC